MVTVLQQNRKLSKMKKMKVSFQVDATLFGRECPLMNSILKTYVKKSAHVIMVVVDGSPITDERIWRSLQNGRS